MALATLEAAHAAMLKESRFCCTAWVRSFVRMGTCGKLDQRALLIAF